MKEEGTAAKQCSGISGPCEPAKRSLDQLNRFALSVNCGLSQAAG